MRMQQASSSHSQPLTHHLAPHTQRCVQRKSDLRRAVSLSIDTAPAVEPGDVQLREVVRYGDALASEDESVLRRRSVSPIISMGKDGGASTELGHSAVHYLYAMHPLDPRFFSSHADAVSVVEERDRSEGEQEERAGTETRDHVSKKAGLVAESMLQRGIGCKGVRGGGRGAAKSYARPKGGQ